jgi:hypothetical protein
MTAVIWDGQDSDGGDEADIAFYDARGHRVAVYKDLYTSDSVLENIAYVSNANVKTVIDPYVPHDLLDRDVVAPGQSPFTPADAKALDAARLTTLKGLLEGCVTRTAAGLDAKRCVVDVFIQPTTYPGVSYASIGFPGPSFGNGHSVDFVTAIRRPNGDVAFYPPSSDSRMAVYVGRSEPDLLNELVAISGAVIP